MKIRLLDTRFQNRFKELPITVSIRNASIGYTIMTKVEGLDNGAAFWRPTMRLARRKLIALVGEYVVEGHYGRDPEL